MSDVSISAVEQHAANQDTSHDDHAHDAHSRIPSKQHIESSKMGMWLYLGSEVMIFGALIGAFVVYRFSEAGAQEVHHIHQQLGLALVSINTFILLASSYAMVMGLRAIQMDNRSGFVRWIGLTTLLGAVFIGGQYIEYSELAHIGATIETPFGTHFYPATAFHGAHVIIGVIWAAVLVLRGRKGKYSAQNNLGIEIFGLYWHFVDVVWIILFTVIYLL